MKRAVAIASDEAPPAASVNNLDEGAAAECLARYRPVPLQPVGVDDTFAESGPYEALLGKCGLTAPSIHAAAREVCKRKECRDV